MVLGNRDECIVVDVVVGKERTMVGESVAVYVCIQVEEYEGKDGLWFCSPVLLFSVRRGQDLQ